MPPISVDVILPCLDEAAALPGVLPLLPDGFRALVVDNGSTDATAAVARNLGAVVVDEPRRGYGFAVHAGLEAAASDVVCVMDGDGSVDPRDLPRLVAALDAGADLVVARRRPVARGVWPWHAQLGNAYVAWLLRRRTGLSVNDIGPVRVARRGPLLRLGVQDRRFGYPLETLVRAAGAKWRVVEVDLAYHPRAAGTRSKVTGSLGSTVRVAADFREALRRAAS